MAGTVCHYCGTSTEVEAEVPAEQVGPGGPTPELVPDDLPPAQEARRFRGLAVPLVAAAVVVGIGYPLTALAVSQAGRLPVAAGDEDPAEDVGKGRARLSGAFTYDGPVTPVGCAAGAPRLVTIEAEPQRYSVLISVSTGSAPGTYELEGSKTFVALTQLLGGSQTWTSLGRTGATGQVTITAKGSVKAVFTGLQASGGGARGSVDGTVEVTCG